MSAKNTSSSSGTSEILRARDALQDLLDDVLPIGNYYLRNRTHFPCFLNDEISLVKQYRSCRLIGRTIFFH